MLCVCVGGGGHTEGGESDNTSACSKTFACDSDFGAHHVACVRVE